MHFSTCHEIYIYQLSMLQLSFVFILWRSCESQFYFGLLIYLFLTLSHCGLSSISFQTHSYISPVHIACGVVTCFNLRTYVIGRPLACCVITLRLWCATFHLLFKNQFNKYRCGRRVVILDQEQE